MHQSKILLAERAQGVFWEATQLLRREGFDCTYTGNVDELLARLFEDDIDLLLVCRRLAVDVIERLPGAGSSISHGIRGYMIELPRYGSKQDAPHLRRTLMQRLVEQDTAADLVSFVRTAIPRVIVLRHAREANRFLNMVKESIRESTLRKGGPDASIENDALDLDARLKAVAMGEAIEHVSVFIDPQRLVKSGCGYQECGRFLALSLAVKETIDVLRATKNHFKSKELGELRKKLEKTLDECVFAPPESRSSGLSTQR